jgi:hypothetical protein
MHTEAREFMRGNMHATTDDAVNGVLGSTYTSRKPPLSPPPPRTKDAKNGNILMLVLLLQMLALLVVLNESKFLQTFLMPPPSSSAIKRVDREAATANSSGVQSAEALEEKAKEAEEQLEGMKGQAA